jgi:hypothetical protein
MIWGQLCPAHGESGHSRWRVGRRLLMLVVVCVVDVFCVVARVRYFTHFVE